MKCLACLVMLLALSLSCTLPGHAQNDLVIDLRVHNGRLELVCSEGLPPGTRLSVTGANGSRVQPIPASEGGGLALIPLNITPTALSTILRAGQPINVTLTSPGLKTRWSVEPLLPLPSPLSSALSPDSPSTGTLAAGAGGIDARLDYAGSGNDYVAFPVNQTLPADATSIGVAYRLDPTNTPSILLSYRISDSRGEFYGTFLPTDSTEGVHLTSRAVRSFDYRYGGPGGGATLVPPLTLSSLLFDTADHHQKGPARATLYGLFVIRRTQFVQALAAPRSSVVSVDFARRAPAVHSMSGFLHGADAQTPSDDLVTPLHPALWRIGYQWLVNRDRLARLQVPTVLILGDSWGGGVPKNAAVWPDFVRSMVKNANGLPFTWDVLNEPNLSPDWGSRPEQFSQLFAQASLVLHQQLGPNVLVSGPSTSHYDRVYLTHFLDYCKAHNARVDVLSWHELDSDADIPSIEDHVREARRLFVDNPAYKALGIRQIQINEIVGPSAQYRPGEILGYLDALERGGADGACKGCWNDTKGGSNCANNTLDGILTPDTHQPRAAWWAYKAYADTVPARVVSRSSDRSVVAFATVGDGQSASVVVGGFTYGDYGRSAVSVVIRLQNVSRLPFVGAGGRVHVRIEKIPDSGEAALPTLAVVQEQDVAVVGGAAQVSLPPLAPHEAYRLTLGKAL